MRPLQKYFFPGMNFKDKVVCLFVCLRLRVFSFGRLVDFVAVLHGLVTSQGWKPSARGGSQATAGNPCQ